MRRLIVVVLTVTGLVLAGCGSGGDGSTTTAALPKKTTEVAQVTVTATPERIEDAGAVVRLTLDTHTTPLDIKLPSAARLSVGGQDWPAKGWDGTEPGGHHREGTLRFEAGGPLSGEVRLELDGLGQPVVLTWPDVQR